MLTKQARLERVHAVIARTAWERSRSAEYADAPHEYVVWFRCPRKADWKILTAAIRDFGEFRTWRGNRQKYLILGELCYWQQWPAINRANVNTLDPKEPSHASKTKRS
jgi:hypothetical protein